MTRRALRIAVLIHVFQEPADVLGGEVALQRQGRVRVAEGGGKVWNIAVHHPLVGFDLALNAVTLPRDTVEGLLQSAVWI